MKLASFYLARLRRRVGIMESKELAAVKKKKKKPISEEILLFL